MESFRDIIVLQSLRVEPLFQSFRRPAVAEGIAVPDTAQRRYFVESGTAASLQRECRVSSHRDIQNIAGVEKVVGNFKTLRGRQLVI